MRATVATVLAFSLAAPLGAASAHLKKPRLDLRAAPRMAFSPVSVLLTAELVGGDDSDEFYCPALEWDWDDGTRSVHEEDCAPFAPGTALERRFTAQHAYRSAGAYAVKVTMRRSSRVLSVATARIDVRPGLGDPSSGDE
jgi:hypothetical protein